MRTPYYACMAIAAVGLAVLAANVTPVRADINIDIDCDVPGHPGKCYDIELVENCMIDGTAGEGSCYNPDTEAGPPRPPRKLGLKAKTLPHSRPIVKLPRIRINGAAYNGSILDDGPSLLPAGPAATGTPLVGRAGSPLGARLR